MAAGFIVALEPRLIRGEVFWKLKNLTKRSVFRFYVCGGPPQRRSREATI